MAKNMGLPAHEVIDRFVAGQVGGTAAAHVPGGLRLRSERRLAGMTLISYATEVAVRGDGFVAVTPKRYSPSTSKAMSRLAGALNAAGYRETTEVTPVMAKVPGRWGGFGPAWHPTGQEMLPFTIWRLPCRRCASSFGDATGLQHLHRPSSQCKGCAAPQDHHEPDWG
jgi:hypothetical protein